MADSFNILDKCEDRLPVARLVDRVVFSRFVGLTIDRGGGEGAKSAVFPSDYAVPDFYRETQVGAWPPANDLLEKYRGGISLIGEFEKPSDRLSNKPLVVHEADDLDAFLANPEAKVAGGTAKLELTPENVSALIESGSTLVRLPDRSGSVLVQAPAQAGEPVAPARVPAEVIAPDLNTLLSDVNRLRAGGLTLKAHNIQALRERGETTVSANGGTPETLVRISGSFAATAAPVDTARSIGIPIGKVSNHYRPKTKANIPQYEIPTFPFMIYVPYQQDWTLEGFARGDLLNSIALAPLEEATIEIFSWDRSKESTETTDEFAWESSLEAGTTNRATRDLVNDVTRNESWKLTSAGVQIGIVEYVDIGVNAAGDVGTAMTTVTKDTVGKIVEATTKAAFKARGLRQTKVSESRELGFEDRSTRKLRNPNTGRPITYDAFEVLAAYGIETYPVADRIQLAVLVESPIKVRFDRLTIIAHEGILRRALLDPSLEPGFEAARWLAAREEYCAVVKEPHCSRPDHKHDCKCEDTPSHIVPPPGSATPVTGGIKPGILAAAAAGANAAPADREDVGRKRTLAAGDEIIKSIADISSATHRIDTAYYAGVHGAELDKIILEYRQWLFRRFGLEKLQPSFWSCCRRFEVEYPPNRTPERVEQLINETGTAWAEALGRSSLATLALGPLTIVALAVELVGELGLKTGWYSRYTMQGFDDAGLGARLQTAKTEVELWRKAMQPPVADAVVQQPPPSGHATPEVGAQAGTPEKEPDPFPDDETARHRVAERALIAHLTEHKSHYLEAIWRSIGPADRVRLIDSVAGELGPQVTPEILGFFGDQIALPFRTDNYPALASAVADARTKVEADPRTGPERIVLPTPGIELRTRVGGCDALEPFAISHRELDLAEADQRVREAKARAERAEHEAKRFAARLAAQPPQLDDPVTHSNGAVAVRIEDETPDTDTPTP